MRHASWLFVVAAVGCSGSSGSEGTEPAAETSVVDDSSALDDTGDDLGVDSTLAEIGADSVSDTGVAVDSELDTGVAADSAISDTAITDSGTTDTAITDSGTADTAITDSGDASTVASNIKHVILIVQENHTFDSYFGRYCTAAPGSNPTCNTGPACCEAAPATEPGGKSPTSLTDAQNAAYDPNHSQACELSEIDGGKMDRFTAGSSVSSCSNAQNFAIAPTPVMKTYHGYAKSYAIADRYFQPLAGASSANDMYFARAQYVFTDNTYEPSALGEACSLNHNTKQYTDPTIADLLIAAGKTFTVYADGYAAMKSARSAVIPYCPVDSSCTFKPVPVPTSPCAFDPSDIPFEYYKSLVDNPAYFKDASALSTDLAGTLPNFAFVKALQWKDEHPGYGTDISNGVTFVDNIVQAVAKSKYASDTLILVTWDEGGGFFDHVAPPADDSIDKQPYGTRVPLVAIGPFTRTNYVSHVEMEHSSVVKFLELNFLGKTGQLGGRDLHVNNIGSLLDPAKTGIVVP
ncbi:MAG: alkaline phosphatase family protein [Polyangiales bacterium]